MRRITRWNVTITARDAHGFPVNDFTGTADLTGWRPSADVTVGAGTYAWDQPLNTYWEDSRTQVIYTRGQIGPATTIYALSLYVTTAPSETIERWTIRMKHYSPSTYSTASWQGPTAGWTTVYQADTTITETGWVTFTFSTPFAYTGGSQNLMIDFSYDGSSWGSSGYCQSDGRGPDAIHLLHVRQRRRRPAELVGHVFADAGDEQLRAEHSLVRRVVGRGHAGGDGRVRGRRVERPGDDLRDRQRSATGSERP